MKLKIITVPDPILRQKAKKTKPNKPEIQKLASEMKKFLAHGNKGKSLGVGLAAPQIGQSIRIIVAWSKSSRKYLPMINPKILWRSKRTKLGVPESKNPFEGCLSIPGIWGRVKRHSVVKILYQTPKGVKVIKKFRGFTGAVVQHEIDHLGGILFIDRISFWQKQKIRKKLKTLEKAYGPNR